MYRTMIKCVRSLKLVPPDYIIKNYPCIDLQGKKTLPCLGLCNSVWHVNRDDNNKNIM